LKNFQVFLGGILLIEVNNIEYIYPSGIKALDGINLKINNGEYVALMGENGAGKTTLIKHFNGLLKPTKGDVYINGINTKNESIAKLSRIVGIVFQNPDHQFFEENIEKEISFALRNFGFKEDIINKRIEWALNFMNLEKYRNQPPFLLSGGEKKRLALAIILSWNPEIIVLDEPTIGQDYIQKEKLMQLIIQLNTQGKTVIIATHDIEFVAESKPRVILLSKGKIIDDGPIEEVLTDIEKIKKCSLILPQVTQLMYNLSDLDFPRKIVSVEDAVKLILNKLEEK
jgi:energy-coupling factor transport system ATP-binding protein